MNKSIAFLLILILSAMVAFSFLAKVKVADEPVVKEDTMLSQPTELVKIPQETLPATSTPVLSTHIQGEVCRQWVETAYTDIEHLDTKLVTGSPDEARCNEMRFSTAPEQGENEFSSYYLRLEYRHAVVPTELNFVFGADPSDSVRVELLDSTSGVGREVFTGRMETGGSCPEAVSLQVTTDINADTVIFALNNIETPELLLAVELVGILPYYVDLPVLWRIPIQADPLSDQENRHPGGLADDQKNTIFVANGRNGLLRYDAEGNLIKRYSIPSDSDISDVAVAGFEHIVVTDTTYQWFVILGYDGSQVNAGGEDFGWDNPREVAVSPLDGNIYLLDETEERSRIRVYTSDNAEWIRDLTLPAISEHGFKGLAFDPQGFLYTIAVSEAAIIKIDPASGEEVNTLGYTELRGTRPSDLALDEKGNIYVLLNANPDDSAIIIFDAQGYPLMRLGKLTYDDSDREEGTFFSPGAIGVSADGHYLFICESGFLTAYQLDY